MIDYFAIPLSTFTDQHHREIETAVREIVPEVLVRMPREELESRLTAAHRLEPPAVHIDQMVQTQNRTVRRVQGGYGSRDQTYVEVDVTVPCTGDIDLLRCRPSQHYVQRFLAGSDGRSSLVFHAETPVVGEAERMALEIKREIDEQLRYWPEMVDLLRADIERYNLDLPGFVSGVVAANLNEAQKLALLKTLIDIPLVERQDEIAQAVKLEPKRIVLPAPVPEATDPRLDARSYLMLLDRLRLMGRAIEQTPGPFTDLGEEALRFFFLVLLNSQFGLEGTATAETFSVGGKTDILVRWQGRTLFVAECKVWRGEKIVDEALDQLMSYLTIRDTQAALMLFVRENGYTAIMKKALARARQHDGFVRDEGAKDDEARLVFRFPQDPDKKVTIAVMGIHLNAKPTP